jgi:hypothetical protein
MLHYWIYLLQLFISIYYKHNGIDTLKIKITCYWLFVTSFSGKAIIYLLKLQEINKCYDLKEISLLFWFVVLVFLFICISFVLLPKTVTNVKCMYVRKPIQ